MLSLRDAIDLDMDVMASGFGFTPWGADTCPTLEQLMASTSSYSSSDDAAATACRTAEGWSGGGEAGDEEEVRRRERRKISNRLSAQRSRARKQQRLEELRGTASQLRAEKRQIEARLHAVARHGHATRCQNARLRAEATELARRLRDSRRLLALQRLAEQLLLQRLAAQPRLDDGYGGPPGGATAFAPAVAPLGLASLTT